MNEPTTPNKRKADVYELIRDTRRKLRRIERIVRQKGPLEAQSAEDRKTLLDVAVSLEMVTFEIAAVASEIKSGADRNAPFPL